MGASFTSIQVRSQDLEAVLTALRAIADSAGMDEHEVDEGADRTVVVLPASGGWISVYDQGTEGQDTALLEGVASSLSGALGSHAISILVHDSDVLALRLFERGTRIDRYDSASEAFGTARDSTGSPRLWKTLLVGGDEGSLAEVFAGKPLVADRGLEAIARVVGLDSKRAHTGYRSLLADRRLDVEAPFLGPRTLRFRHRARPAWERAAEGPPSFTLYSRPSSDHPIRLAVGDELRLGAGAMSAGGASRGVRVAVGGSAIDGALVEVTRFELLVGSIGAGARHRMLEPQRALDAEGRAILVIELDDVPFSAGAATQSFPRGADTMAMLEAQQSRLVQVNVVGRVARAGHGSVDVRFTPLANTDGAVGATVQLDLSEPFRRPLRAHSDKSQRFRRLAEDTFSILLAPIDAPQREVAAIAREAIESLASMLPPLRVESSVFASGSWAHPKHDKGDGATLLGGERLAALIESMEREAEVSVRGVRGEVEFGPDMMAAPGWSVVVGLGLPPDRDEARIPTLAISIERASLDECHRARARALLDAMLTRAIDRGALSASITRCGLPVNTSVQHTAYESACGTQGIVSSTRAWCRRFLRVPGDEVTFLSAELAARLDPSARRELEAIARVEARGDGSLLVRLHERAHIDWLERALAAILPTHEEARSAQAEYLRTRRR